MLRRPLLAQVPAAVEKRRGESFRPLEGYRASSACSRGPLQTLVPRPPLEPASDTAATIVKLPDVDCRDHLLIPNLLARRSAYPMKSEERRVGKEWVSTCRSRWHPSHKNKKK